MLVGVCQIEMLIPESHSLKEKRFVISSLKKRIRNKFNVSVSEIAELDKWQRACLGIAIVSNEQRFIDQTMGSIMHLLELDGRLEVLKHLLEIY